MRLNRSLEQRRTDIYRHYAARCPRGLGDCFGVVVLPAYLSAIGFWYDPLCSKWMCRRGFPMW